MRKGPKGSGGDEVGGAQGGAGLRVPLGGSEGAQVGSEVLNAIVKLS